MNEKLTAKQLDNWRQVLLTMLGPYALIAPDEQIQRFRDRMQAHLSGDAARGASVSAPDAILGPEKRQDAREPVGPAAGAVARQGG